jgi:hypothetical protein
MTLVLELLHKSNGWEVWPAIESWEGRKEWDRDTSRRAIGHDPADAEPNELAARAMAAAVARLARTRYHWSHVEVRVCRPAPGT